MALEKQSESFTMFCLLYLLGCRDAQLLNSNRGVLRPIIVAAASSSNISTPSGPAKYAGLGSCGAMRVSQG